MKIYKEKRIKGEVLVDITCDRCGKSCRDGIDLNFEFATFSATWGYGSKRDTEQWECYLCEECAVKIRDFIESNGGKIAISYYI